MTFNWKMLVDLAKQLENQARASPESEASQRTAVNRAYFGAFCHAREYAISFLKFDPSETADDHRKYRDHLSMRRFAGAAKRLERLRQWRNDADYRNEMLWDNVPATVATAIKEAEWIISSMSPQTKTGSN